MLSCLTMCFSSSLICLLVVTCHGSVINSYQLDIDNKEGKDGSRQNNISQILSKNLIKHNLTSSNSTPILAVLHRIHKNAHTTRVEVEDIHVSSEPAAVPSLLRKARAAGDNFELPTPKRNIQSKPTDHQNSPQSSPNSPSTNHDHHSHEDDNVNDDHDSHDLDHSGESDAHDLSRPHDDYLSTMNKPTASNHMMHTDSSTGILYHHDCNGKSHEHDNNGTSHESELKGNSDLSNNQSISWKVWLYASAAVVIISLCGLFSVAVIPIMQKWFYQTLLQFLVGLAVGSLSGDGLLHLMPHAVLSGEISHEHTSGGTHQHTSDHSSEGVEIKAIWRGLAALCGIFFFFVAERLLGALTTYRRQKKESRLSGLSNIKVNVARDDGANNGSIGEKLAQPKKNSYDNIKEKDGKEAIQMLPPESCGSPTRRDSSQSVHEIGFHGRASFSVEPGACRPDSDSSVVVSEHHGHGHGHSHEVPHSISAVAWMVIMGDGLHNFCDGLAIGAAFASSEADGISTTIAVFCHELPHELGDFAMLLKTGMKVKQALLYNGLSSVLCFVGMVIGVSLGNVTSAASWIFAGTAGMFLYIALVDMLPELSTPANNVSSTIVTTCVQVLGIVIGICVMLLIALYEHELRSMIS